VKVAEERFAISYPLAACYYVYVQKSPAPEQQQPTPATEAPLIDQVVSMMLALLRLYLVSRVTAVFSLLNGYPTAQRDTRDGWMAAIPTNYLHKRRL
jgi:hypothetical protein